MIAVGCDIERINRFRKVLRNKRFLSNIFTHEELKHCLRRKKSEVYLAQKFVCKEAVFKALSSLGQNIPLNFIKISDGNKRKNTVQILFKKIDAKYKVFVSVSNTEKIAFASSIAEKI